MDNEVRCGVSVIICCYNSAQQLPATLMHLANQELSIDWEILIVINNCSDNTEEVALENGKKLGLANMIITREDVPGLTNARKRGVDTASYNVIIFCDDDNWLAKDYVQNAFDKISSNKSIGVLGGKSLVLNEALMPKWWNEYKHGYAVGEQELDNGEDQTGHYIWGAGMVSRKELLQKVFDEKFPTLLEDRTGTQLGSGGDVEICKRIILLGFELAYDDSLVLFHNITIDRLSESYRDKMFEGHSKGAEILMAYNKVIGIYKLPVATRIYHVFRELIKMGTKPFRNKRDNQDSLNKLAIMLMQPKLAPSPVYKLILNFRHCMSASSHL